MVVGKVMVLPAPALLTVLSLRDLLGQFKIKGYRRYHDTVFVGGIVENVTLCCYSGCCW
jgi:hypothetical protein